MSAGISRGTSRKPGITCEGLLAASHRPARTIRRSSGSRATCAIRSIRRQAVAEMRAVIHSAGWVSLGQDASGLSQAINVEATRGLLDDAKRASVERFVLTSTLHTLAAGTAANPADETSTWNLQSVDSPYARTKREAESLVRSGEPGHIHDGRPLPWHGSWTTRPEADLDPNPPCTCSLSRGVSAPWRHTDCRRGGTRPRSSHGSHSRSTWPALCSRRPLSELCRTRGSCGGNYRQTPTYHSRTGHSRAAAERLRQSARTSWYWPWYRVVRLDCGGRLSSASCCGEPRRRLLRPGASTSPWNQSGWPFRPWESSAWSELEHPLDPRRNLHGGERRS